ncbi:hypothetical protein [Altibacter sp. HG106]|uniref:hypothetical protein n=1 Tax=Altibacter sp. HG106 TaxID=3023937 RepID=UPI0023503A42|nr:hypothetical protein [Altibacter sp. HG106]MDC7994307.1 hypothetical protein [Altibacter sp. HG106]
MEHSIFKRIEAAPKPDFGDILTKSFNLFKEVWTQGLLHGLLSMAFVFPFIVIVYIPMIPFYIEAFEASQYGYEPSFDYAPAAIVGYALLILVLSFVMQIFVFAINLHFYRVMKKADFQTHEDTGGYFTYLKGNFGKLFVLNLAVFGIAILAALLCYLPIFYVMVPLQLIAPIFAFNSELSVSDTIKASFKLGNRFWLIIFGLIIVSSMIAQLGILACFIGVIVTAYFVHIPMYYVYKDTIGFTEGPTAAPEAPDTGAINESF